MDGDKQYDDTDKAVAFKPWPEERMILKGKINDNGNENEIIVLERTSKAGDKYYDLYEKVTPLYESKPPKTTAFDAPYKDRRIGMWKNVTKNGDAFLSGKIQDKYMPEGQDNNHAPAPITQQAPTQTSSGDLHPDDIPF